MNEYEIGRHIESRGVVFDMAECRDPIEIGIALGLIKLQRIGVESPGIYDSRDIAVLRKTKAIVIEQTGFGQVLFQAIPVESAL